MPLNYAPAAVAVHTIDPFYSVSPLEGIREAAGETINVEYALGDTLLYTMIDPIPASCFVGPDGETPGLLAEYFSNVSLSGNPAFYRHRYNNRFHLARSAPCSRDGTQNVFGSLERICNSKIHRLVHS